jgi:C4-dicarboxylate-specific signal transduction histidine kinase
MSAWRARWADLALQRKLLVVSVLTAAVAMLVALMALLSYDLVIVRPRLVQDLASRMDLVTLNLDVDLNFGDRAAARRTLSALRGTKDINSACLFDMHKREFASYGRGVTVRCDWPAEATGPGHRFHGDFLTMLAPVRFEREVVGYLQVEYALRPLASRLRQYGLVLAVVLMTLMTGGFLHALLMRRLVTLPLLALSKVADQVTREQRYDLHVPVAGQDEVGRLAGTFNAMLATVAARDAALRQYSDKLEEQVQLRTAQMVEANKGLEVSLETLQRAQDELVRSEKLAALGALVAGVAHELNTPIGNSLLAVSTLIDQTNAFTKASAEGIKRSTLQSFVENIGSGGEIVLRNLHRAGELVSSFKQVAVDRTTSQSRTFLLSDLTAEILLVLVPTVKKTGIVVRQEIPPGIEMNSYPGPLGQVLINLINNGLTHGFEDRSDGEILVAARALEGAMVELVVSDNGAGIAPENMGRIYDPFFTTKLGRGGSGLGLNIVYNIVYGILRGKIEVQSELGRGTRFMLVLPLSS